MQIVDAEQLVCTAPLYILNLNNLSTNTQEQIYDPNLTQRSDFFFNNQELALCSRFTTKEQKRHIHGDNLQQHGSATNALTCIVDENV